MKAQLLFVQAKLLKNLLTKLFFSENLGGSIIYVLLQNISVWIFHRKPINHSLFTMKKKYNICLSF